MKNKAEKNCQIIILTAFIIQKLLQQVLVSDVIDQFVQIAYTVLKISLDIFMMAMKLKILIGKLKIIEIY